MRLDARRRAGRPPMRLIVQIPLALVRAVLGLLAIEVTRAPNQVPVARLVSAPDWTSRGAESPGSVMLREGCGVLVIWAIVLLPVNRAAFELVPASIALGVNAVAAL